ncbi:caspase-1-like [Suncus etruscus]|uniref:caspase-1-like n=1 Tax=Suncus etruscus TaxID=109475 RepID=UPI0021107F71|nr:caspase-1-like [Suncus etruscus]
MVQAKETTSCEPGGILKLCPLDQVQRIQQEKASEIYPIKKKSSQRTRLALIICNIEFENLSKRTGAEIDTKNMTTLLQDLGYSVEVRGDLTAPDMAMELKSFAARPEHASADSTFVVLMSHGIREGICGKKFSKDVNDLLSIDQIFKSLNTQNCPNLKDKPKVIIIQACRGDNVSWRDPTKGSLFIIALIKNLKEYAWSCDLEELFRKVRSSFEHIVSRAQMPTTERVTFTKAFYLFPGY